MALLASCWLLIESFIIPDGLLKWSYLSSYIHPFVLACCQVFLWLKVLQRLLFRLASSLSLFIFRFISRVAVFWFSAIRPTADEVFYDAKEPDIPQGCETVASSSSSWIHSGVVLGIGKGSKFEATEETDHGSSEESWMNEFLCSEPYNGYLLTYGLGGMSTESLSLSDGVVTSSTVEQHTDWCCCSGSMDQAVVFKLQDADISLMNSCSLPHKSLSGLLSSSELKTSPSSVDNQDFIHEEDNSRIGSSQSSDPQLLDHTHAITQDDCYTSSAGADLLVDHEHFPTFCSSNSLVRAMEQQMISQSVQKDNDPFHQKHAERMRFFDLLYHERLHGLNAVLNQNQHLMTPDLSMQQISWSKMATKRLLRSLECDLELVYVAQSCLFWEALHHQYLKVEALTSSENPQTRLFHPSVSGKFQEFQILVERFVEEEKPEGQRCSNDTHKRLSFQRVLQVPDVTGFMMEEESDLSLGAEAIRASEILKGIKKCIEAFWLYVRTDEKKPLWRFKAGILRTPPPVEDPVDLELLYSVAKAVHKKWVMLKDLQGKKRGWLRRKVKPLQAEDEKMNLLFALIDIKLVQRLLRMSLISSSQLRWSLEKLDNIEFREGKVFRGPTSPLFPSS